MELRRVSLSAIRPYERNPRKNGNAVDAVAESIKQCGYCAPIVCDENLVILAGHTRYAALRRIGWKDCEVCVVPGLTDEQKRKYRLLDNQTNTLATWDFDLLSAELEGLDFGGFDFGFDTLIDERTEQHERDKERTQQAVCDILNLDKAQYSGVGKYDIPALKPVYELPEIREWIGFNYVLSDKDPEGKAVHFFVKFTASGEAVVSKGGLFSRGKTFKTIDAFQTEANRRLDAIAERGRSEFDRVKSGRMVQIEAENLKSYAKDHTISDTKGHYEKQASASMKSARIQQEAALDMKRRLATVVDAAKRKAAR